MTAEQKALIGAWVMPKNKPASISSKFKQSRYFPRLHQVHRYCVNRAGPAIDNPPFILCSTNSAPIQEAIH